MRGCALISELRIAPPAEDAVAAVAAGIRRGLLDARVRVTTPGGDLTVRREGGDNPVWMTGPALTIFDGEMEIDES